MLLAATDDAEVAIAAVGAGARIARRCFGTATERIDKGAGDFATTADVEAEAPMLAVVREERPEDAVLGEESGRSGASDALGSGPDGLVVAADQQTHAALLRLMRKQRACGASGH